MAQLANERDHFTDNVTVSDALFLHDHAARHQSCSVSKHHDGYNLLVHLAKEAVICVQLRDDQFLAVSVRDAGGFQLFLERNGGTKI